MKNYGELAGSAFHGAENYNCAQAIFKTFQEEFSVDDETILLHKKSGGGRVKDNVCGAIYAVAELVPEKREQLVTEFEKRTGNFKCRDLKIAGKFSCKQCVKIAADILAEELA